MVEAVGKAFEMQVGAIEKLLEGMDDHLASIMANYAINSLERFVVSPEFDDETSGDDDLALSEWDIRQMEAESN